MWPATSAALHLWDDEQWLLLSSRYLDLARAAGALSEMPLALSTRAMVLLFAGDLGTAASLVEEQQTVTEATGSQLAPYSGDVPGRHAGTDGAWPRRLIEITNRGAPARARGSASRSPSGPGRCSTTVKGSTARPLRPPDRPCTTRSIQSCTTRASPTGPRPS